MNQFKMKDKLYIKSPIDVIGVTAGKPYEVTHKLINKKLVGIIDNSNSEVYVYTENSKRNCVSLNNEARWQFCDKDGNVESK